ncbi:MAG TPA: B12-binding domain-containing radical SAM protein [Planctomycetota bacterium]|nr:B12-binding domain-containing radical SAM protein [Planctomycetota bacterium]
MTNPPRILLLNPPIHDFAAYDFWLKPYGLLNVAGRLRERADLHLFDYLDRHHPRAPAEKLRADVWGRGEFHSELLDKPAIFSEIPRRFRRFGLPRAELRAFLEREGPFDVALIQTVMTYWYPGVKEAIDDLRALSPETKIVLGGVYATLCPAHAKSLGADFVLEGLNLDPLWKFLNLEPNPAGLPCWDLYSHLDTGVLKLADGCPFKCTYCSVPQVYPTFHARPMDRSLAELDFLIERGVRNIVFYDDALLYQPDRILIPFLKEVVKRNARLNFHTPNALNARFISPELAELMVESGFKVVYLGFESSAYEWQKKTGGKVYSHELARAIENLCAAGAGIDNICAYLIVAHPNAETQHVEDSMRFASSLGIRVMLAEFSPIPGTPDGEACRRWIDLDEPLYHNKTAFPIFFMGAPAINRIKNLARELNQKSKVDSAQKAAIVETAV